MSGRGRFTTMLKCSLRDFEDWLRAVAGNIRSCQPWFRSFDRPAELE